MTLALLQLKKCDSILLGRFFLIKLRKYDIPIIKYDPNRNVYIEFEFPIVVVFGFAC